MDSAVAAGSRRGWLAAFRARAGELAGRLPWPTTQQEEWRRTSLNGLKLEELEASTMIGSRGGNSPGRVGLELDPEARAQGVTLQELGGDAPEAAAELLESALQRADNRLAAWHLACLSHGALLHVPAGVQLRQPVLVELQETAGAGFPHLSVVLGREARAVVVARLAGGGGLVNAGVDAQVGDGGCLELYQLQDLDPGTLFFSHAAARVSRDACFRSLEVHLGSRLVKTRLDCSLEGPGAESRLNGAYLAGAGQHMDLATIQRHRTPRATSRALYKGAVKDSGRTVYQGLIEVSPGASGTDAYLSNKNLLLNDGARADSIPSLRIDNNDVRCTHGSTTGRVSPEELFYLASRGLGPAEARALLVLGYFQELLDSSPFADQAFGRISGRLAA